MYFIMRNFTDEELEQVANKLYKECLDKGMDEDDVVAVNVSVTLDLIKKIILELQNFND
jgi:hypothetical protein|nr:MAG TPA: mutase [Caudoviricetes sp.]